MSTADSQKSIITVSILVKRRLEIAVTDEKSVIIVTANNFISRSMVTSLLRSNTVMVSGVVLLPNFSLFENKSRKLTKKWIRNSSPSFIALKFLDIFVDTMIAKIRQNTISDVCRFHDVDSITLKNQSQLFSYLKRKETRPTLLISMGPVILSKDVIEYPTGESINLHGGRLPEYRGLGNYVWMLADHETIATATLHILEEKIDAGSVVLTEDLLIDKNWSAFMLNYQLASAMSRLASQYLALTENQLIEAIKIQSARVPIRSKYHGIPDSGAVKLLRQQGRKMLMLKDLLLLFH
jgi:folate-dependent phosphoribosylglycinamide formyltransferase PurN